MTIQSFNKNPNELHAYLISNNCIPKSLKHNAIYNDLGNKIKEATEINIEIELENEITLQSLVDEFMLL